MQRAQRRGDEHEAGAEPAADQQRADEQAAQWSHTFTKVSRAAASASSATLTRHDLGQVTGGQGAPAALQVQGERERVGGELDRAVRAAPRAPSASRRRRGPLRRPARSPRSPRPRISSPPARIAAGRARARPRAACARSGRSAAARTRPGARGALWKKIATATFGRAGTPGTGNPARPRLCRQRDIDERRDDHNAGDREHRRPSRRAAPSR